ncbi:MAG TPA: UvrD-helicase domain-containing protein, partial [Chloroflexia bacterium]|nr:UvrD-helicase domain-containing protein [Chloroflexia bacterium]
MALTERWRTIQQLAAAQRPLLDPATGGPAATLHLVHAALEAHGLDVFPLPSGDPLLGGARAVFDQEFVAYDASLPAPAVAFSLAHELGHKLLHSGGGHCTAADIDEEAAAPLLAAPGGVETYSPRQQRELEANAFAAAFLMPAAELRAGFLAGLSYADLAARYGVSETAMLNTLAATLLVPVAASTSTPDDGSSPTHAGEPTGQETGPAAAFPLDESQRAAATVVEGPVLVDAGPGTGKTRTLIERVGFLLREGHAPESILALTFSNRAAGEMRERLRATAPGAADAITVGTFHAFCLQLLQEHGAEAGLPDGVTLIDDVQAAAWLETGLARLGLDHYASLWEPARSLPDILGAISRARDELVDAARYAELAADAARAADAADPPDPKARERADRWAEVARVYAVYEELLERKGALDFGGLLL